ncbi:MAG: alpha/beta hydrolase [Pseudomonadota bacterium]
MFERFCDFCELKSEVVRYPTSEPLDYLELEEIVLAKLPQATPYLLVAESFSGPIAVSIASANPSGLVGLVLCASFVVNPVPYLRVFSPLLGMLPMWSPSAILSTLLMGRFRTEALVKETQGCLKTVSPTVLRHRLQAVLNVDYREKMRKVEVPAIYFRATEDRVVSKRSSQEFMDCCTHGEIIDVEAPHFLLQCCPEVAAGHIERFAERHANAP